MTWDFMGRRSLVFERGRSLVVKMSKIWRVHVYQNRIDRKMEVKKQFFLSNFAKQVVARVLTFYFTTRDRP